MSGSKSMFPWKSILLILIVFTFVLCGLLLRIPLKIIYYANRLQISDANRALAAVNALLSMGEEGEKAFFSKCPDGEDAARLLLEYWSKPETKLYLDRTALAVASEKGYTRVAELFLAKGAELKVWDRHRLGPLHLAAVNGHTNTADMLIKAGADVNGRMYEKTCTPLHKAVENGHVKTVKLLLDRGADANAEMPQGVTPLHLATNLKENCMSIAQLLLDYNANASAVDSTGCTPLHIAARRGDKGVAALLIKCGADVNRADNLNRTPLFIAAYCGFKKLVQLLTKNKADLNYRNEAGQTALHYVVIINRHDIAGILLENGANTDARSLSGKTPLDLVTDDEIRDLLLSHGAKTGKELREEEDRK